MGSCFDLNLRDWHVAAESMVRLEEWGPRVSQQFRFLVERE